MLKIKDNVDLKELEKYGFKPKYDEDTGELIEYYIDYAEKIGKRYYNSIIKFYIVKKTKLFSTKRWCISEYWDFFREEYGEEMMNLIFDLIKADLVEKVGDK